MRGYPQFCFFGIPIALAKICFSGMVKNRAKILDYLGINRHYPYTLSEPFEGERSRVIGNRCKKRN